MTAIPRYRSHAGPVILSAGFRPFFLAASIWAAVAIPLWLGAHAEGLALPTTLAPPIWHTRNWLTKARPEVAPPVPAGRFELAAMVMTGLALLIWAIAPDASVTPSAALAAGIALALRLSRWRGLRTVPEPLLVILHVGYGWLALGLLLLGLNGLSDMLPATAALHALTVGAVGTITRAVMIRASLGHTGRPLSAGPVTKAIYALITIAALLRILSPLAGNRIDLALLPPGAAPSVCSRSSMAWC